MLTVPISLLLALRDCLRARAVLHLELLALRHQIHVLTRSRPLPPRLTRTDRLLWIWLSWVWHGWPAALVIVKPETVIAWHRQGFRLFWTWKSRRRVGRPTVPLEIRALIRTMSDANPLWGAPRIHGELLKLGIDVCQATVAKYMGRQRRPPSQTWRTFLTNHFGQIVAADFFVVPTATCRVLFVLVLMAHERRRVVHVAVTARPTAGWTAQQLREAFPWDTAPRYLLRDRDHAFTAWAKTASAMDTASSQPHVRRGRTRTPNGSSGLSGGSASTMSSSSVHRDCAAYWSCTSRTTNDRARISHSTRTRRFLARSLRTARAASWRSRRSAAFITGTNDTPPDQPLPNVRLPARIAALPGLSSRQARSATVRPSKSGVLLLN
jgi:putative transposase